MGCKADLAANSLGFGKKFNAADRPSPAYHGPREVMQRVLKDDQDKKKTVNRVATTPWASNWKRVGWAMTGRPVPQPKCMACQR